MSLGSSSPLTVLPSLDERNDWRMVSASMVSCSWDGEVVGTPWVHGSPVFAAWVIPIVRAKLTMLSTPRRSPGLALSVPRRFSDTCKEGIQVGRRTGLMPTKERHAMRQEVVWQST